jgi:hypothetical protein
MPRATHRKKLVEIALPPLVTNDASAYDKMPVVGSHPKGIPHRWARLPLPMVWAVLFSACRYPAQTNAWVRRVRPQHGRSPPRQRAGLP